MHPPFWRVGRQPASSHAWAILPEGAAHGSKTPQPRKPAATGCLLLQLTYLAAFSPACCGGALHQRGVTPRSPRGVQVHCRQQGCFCAEPAMPGVPAGQRPPRALCRTICPGSMRGAGARATALCIWALLPFALWGCPVSAGVQQPRVEPPAACLNSRYRVTAHL